MNEKKYIDRRSFSQTDPEREGLQPREQTFDSPSTTPEEGDELVDFSIIGEEGMKGTTHETRQIEAKINNADSFNFGGIQFNRVHFSQVATQPFDNRRSRSAMISEILKFDGATQGSFKDMEQLLQKQDHIHSFFAENGYRFVFGGSSWAGALLVVEFDEESGKWQRGKDIQLNSSLKVEDILLAKTDKSSKILEEWQYKRAEEHAQNIEAHERSMMAEEEERRKKQDEYSALQQRIEGVDVNTHSLKKVYKESKEPQSARLKKKTSWFRSLFVKKD